MMSRRVIELIRVSTKQQADADRAGIPAQRAVNRKTEAAFGLSIVRSIEYSDVSGAAVLLAPEMQELLKLIEDPEIHGVIAKEFSRLIRPEKFTDYALLQAFVDTKTVLYLPDGPVDFSSKSGRLLGGIRALMAGNEISDMRERAWDAKEEKRKAGKFPQSKICLPSDVGYSEERGWYYKPEAEIVREAFRIFLAGETSYVTIGRRLGVNPFTIRVKLRNPIYTGWRVIDKRRDPSPGARRTRADGRQGDRPKVRRAPEDVIRVRVIDEGLISEEEFERVQAIIAAKEKLHWRVKGGHVHRYTYNGFMTCAECDHFIYTKFRRRDYYVCTGRYLHKLCRARYMHREVLEAKLDRMFSERLTDAAFLRSIAEAARAKSEGGSAVRRAERLSDEIDALTAKRGRVLDAYFDGDITKPERDERASKIDADIRRASDLLARCDLAPSFTVSSLVSAFAPFYEFEFLSRGDKRKLLSALAPEIRVADYHVAGVSMLAPGGDDVTLMGKGSSRPRA